MSNINIIVMVVKVSIYTRHGNFLVIRLVIVLLNKL